MKRVLVFFAVFLFAGTLGFTASYAAPDRVPFTIRDDFETGEMYAWESYPYAQDIGYEPFTICQQQPAHNDSRYSLGHIRRAWDVVEVFEGFIKEIDLWTAGNTRLKAAIFLSADRKPSILEVTLCLFDGTRYFHTIPSPAVNRWLELDIPIKDFAMNGKPLAAGVHVQAVTIKATYPLVNHLASYNINLDDFSINGERQRRFVALDPESANFEMYSYSVLNRHFYYGDAFNLSVRSEEAPGKYDLAAVTASLIDPSGKTVVAGVPLKSVTGNAWKVEKAYTFLNTDPRGQWRVDLVGKDASGNETSWGFRFIMPGNRLTPKDHPRLFFTADELKKRIAGQSEAEKKMMEGFIAGPDRFKNFNVNEINENDDLTDTALTGGPFAKTVGSYGWAAPINALTGIIESGAIRYAFTGDEVAGQKAKEALLKLSKFKRWNHPWQLARGNWTYYPVGYTIGPVATGYDLLYPLLSEAEKKVVRDGLMDKGFKMFYRDMVEMNRMPSSVTNHIAVIVSNLAMAATAVYGEDPSNPAFEPYLSGILAKMKRFMDRTYYPDGGYGEPIGYQSMATADIVQSLHVLDKNFGIDYTTTTNLKDMWRYPLQGAYTNGRMPDYGDDGIHSGWNFNGYPFQWLTYKTKNPYTANYTQAAPERGRGDFFRWLWYTKDLPTKTREEFIPSHHFPVKGTMFLRSDWSDEGTIMVFKSGPNSNHYHYDQGSIVLQTNGEILLSEAGLETFHGYHAYYGSTFYPFYTTQAMGHNVMLVDTDPESQEPADYRNGIAALQSWPTIPHSFAGWNADEVEGDLTCVYKGKLEKYTRSFLFMKPDILFMYDRVKSPEGHSFQWLFHAEDTDNKSSFAQEGNRVRINRPKARLTMDVLAPVNVKSRIRMAEREERILQFDSADKLTSSEFLAVLVPAAIKNSTDPEKKFTSTLLQPQGWTGAKVVLETSTTLAFFRTGAAGVATVEGFTTDAERFAVEMDTRGTVIRLFLRGAEFSGKGAAVKSAKPVSLSALYTAAGVEVEADAGAVTELAISMAKAPAGVTLNGAAVKKFTYDKKAKMLKVSIPAGHTLVKVL